MRNKKLLALQQLDLKLKQFRGTEKIKFPPGGWVNNIRTSLNMTLEQLGNKLGISKSGVKNLEEREASGTISIQYLNDIGKALDLKFVYGFVPNHGSFEKLVEAKAHEMAAKIIDRTSQNMALEDQAVNKDRLNQAIEELAMDIKREVRKSLWD